LHSLLPRLAATARLLEELARRYGGSARGSSNGLSATRQKRRGRAGGSSKIQDKLLATLKAGKGLQLKDVVARSRLDTGAVQYHLRALRAKKKVRVVGSRKEARWFA